MTELYPCADCIVKGMCVNLCDKLIKEMTTSHADMHIANALIEHKRCIDCGCFDAIEVYSRGIMCIDCRSVYFTVLLHNPPSIRRVYKSGLSADHGETTTTFTRYINNFSRW
jgi:hypothetical protein